jgi:hypothetical protein
MAFVQHLIKIDLEIVTEHSEAPATFCVVTERDGSRCLQIDTYGSEARKLEGKKSQSIRLSPSAIGDLREILQTYF